MPIIMNEPHAPPQPRHDFALTDYARQPLDGPQGSLAGVAEPRARLTVAGLGEFINVGSKDAPRWKKSSGEPEDTP